MQRGALDLVVSNYGGYSSEEEVPIGRVSTKRCSEDSKEELTLKRTKIKLPTPEIFSKISGVVEDVPIDDPSLHGGRERCFPHERGNWVTYVFVPYNSPDISSMLEINGLITRTLSNIPLQEIDHFHISLTKTIVLKHHWIESFMQSIREKASLINKFMLMFNDLNVYCNEERTRTFIGLEIRTGYDTLIKLVAQMDSCLNEFRLPPFYKNPSFHMSILWCVGDHELEIRKRLPELISTIENKMGNTSMYGLYSYVTQIECKSGNKLFTFNLS